MPTPRNSTNLKLLLGSRPDRIDTATPIPARRTPQPLPWFNLRQRQIWDEVTEELADMELLSRADRYEIAAYVAVASHLELLTAELNADPSYRAETKYGFQVEPRLLAFDRLTMRLSALGVRLGLSPAGRSSIHGRSPAKTKEQIAAGPFAS